MKKPLIILAGPTAIGKTALSILLAQKVNGEIISADSMQVYKMMDIGTAKISQDEMCGIKHYLIDEYDPADDFNVVLFQKEAKKAIEEITAKGKIPIIAGGTGFYIQSILYDIDFTESVEDVEYREYLSNLAKEKGNEYVHDMLKKVDEKSADNIHANNLKRVIRALEFNKQTGKKISEHNEEQSKNESPYNYCYFVLDDDRDKIYERINDRVDIMMEKGLLDEVKRLKEAGYKRELVSMQGLGYNETLRYLDGEISLDEAVYLIKQGTRHFAKKQITWFKREKDVIFIKKRNDEEMLEEMTEVLKKKGII